MAEDKKSWKSYFKFRIGELQEMGLSGAHSSRAANAEVKALKAVEEFFTVFDELVDAGKDDMAGMLCAEFYASMFLVVPKEERRKFMEIILKMAEEMEKEIESVE